MDWRNPARTYNIVRDWNMSQGYGDPSDELVFIKRDLNVRHVTIENSSDRVVGVAITTYPRGGPIPLPNFYLRGGEIRDVAINTIGGPMQFIWMLDPVTKLPVGEASPLRTNSNQIVLRDGVQKWYIHYFHSSGYK